MSARLSLRAHVLLGAVLWTVGLFAVAGVLVTQLMYKHPDAPRLFHGMFLHTPIVFAVAVVSLVGGLWQVRRGLTSLDELRARLSAVHEGRDVTVGGRYPIEVQPLVDDLNTLLDHRDRAVRRALAKAGDLAHGLKTPLTVLAQEAERADAAGAHALAEAIGHEVDRMRRQVDYHLAQARAAASGAMPGARCVVRESVEGLCRTMRRLHAARNLTLDFDVPADHAVRAQREDLDEMLGNLIDNACKWARTRVTLRSSVDASEVIVTIDDDGPGLEPSMREAVLQRGVRADQAAPGSGLGLAIVRDLAELHGGAVSLHESPVRGVRARLRLPAV